MVYWHNDDDNMMVSRYSKEVIVHDVARYMYVCNSKQGKTEFMCLQPW